jgi:Zn-dependent M28 family amino/carboxypeptidase
MKAKRWVIAAVSCAAVLAGIESLTGRSGPDRTVSEGAGFGAEALARHVKILASDEYEGRGSDLAFPADSAFVGWTLRARDAVTIADSEMVFVGYGVVAPEQNWNDYASVDARGKTVIMLVNDPGFATKDPDLFNGKAMTYYGRWMYRLEEAARQGAVANRRGFKAVPLRQKASVTMHDRVKPITSRNVVGLVCGSKRPDEVIIYTAHWDHFGINPALPGKDKILNGAVDNATGVAGLIELGRAFMKPGASPERTIMFLAVTAEEQGMLGSAHYAANPIFPLAKTVAVLNLESLNIFGPTRDVVVIGYGQCDLDEYIQAAAAEQGRVLSPEPTPEDGGFFRSDHFPFARVGVPAMMAGSGIDDREKGPKYGRRVREAWGPANYHRPSDEFSPAWNFAGMIEDLDMYYSIGSRLSHETPFPGWKPGSEFKAKRDAMMAR